MQGWLKVVEGKNECKKHTFSGIGVWTYLVGDLNDFWIFECPMECTTNNRNHL